MIYTVPANESPRSIYHSFNCSDEQGATIDILRNAHKGFAGVKGYIPSTNWIKAPVQDIQMNVGFIVSRLYVKQVQVLESLKIEDLDLSKWIPSKGANSCDNAKDQFDFCIAKLIESKSKSLEGELNNAHSEAHARNYCGVCNSIKVNFVTEKDPETGKQIPVLDENGIPTVETILLPYLEVKTVTVEAGERKVKNSGSKVLMDNAIEKALGKRFAFRMLSLKADNFESVTIGKQHIDPDMVAKAEMQYKMLHA